MSTVAKAVEKAGVVARIRDQIGKVAGKVKEESDKDDRSLFDVIGGAVAAVSGRGVAEKAGTGGILVGGAQAVYGVGKLVTGQPGGLTHTVFGTTTAACGVVVRGAGVVNRWRAKRAKNEASDDSGEKGGDDGDDQVG